MKLGITVLLEEYMKELSGKKIGLVVNQTSTDHNLNHLIDILVKRNECEIGCIFGPEHGVRGDLQDMISCDDSHDDLTKIKIKSLYGQSESSLKPSLADLQNIDAMIFDIQDIGSRYYTFIYTMAYCMMACSEANIPMFVCDRPNPINGLDVEGNVLSMNFRSFVGRYPLAIRHGMTALELAIFFQRYCGVDCDLRAIKMDGWKRHMWFEDTNIPWVQTSPNMPTIDTATVYPGMCLIEGTNLSEGRGTTRPFHLIGAPWINPHFLAETLMKESLPGIIWRPAYFTPMFHKFKGECCKGVELHITNRKEFKPFLSGILLIQKIFQLYNEKFKWRTEPYEFVSDKLAIDLLFGTDEIRMMIENGKTLEDIESSWKTAFDDFIIKRASCLIY